MIYLYKPDVFNFRINTSNYYIKIVSYIDGVFELECINHGGSIYSFYNKLNIDAPGLVANQFMGNILNAKWCNPFFKDKNTAINFLFYLDKLYNSEPKIEMSFINLKLFL